MAGFSWNRHPFDLPTALRLAVGQLGIRSEVKNLVVGCCDIWLFAKHPIILVGFFSFSGKLLQIAFLLAGYFLLLFLDMGMGHLVLMNIPKANPPVPLMPCDFHWVPLLLGWSFHQIPWGVKVWVPRF